MQLIPGVENVDAVPAIYIRELDAICVADLHLGYEGIMAEYYGLFLPKTQFKEELELLREMLRSFDRKPKRIVLLGDVKHEFSETSYHEYKELKELFLYLEQNFEQIMIIKGNHDNFIARATKGFEKIELFDELELGDYFLTHGHKLEKPLSYFAKKGRKVIIGHEHPAIALYSDVGGREKLKCFLAGKCKRGFYLLVLPAFSTLAEGTEINVVPQSELLSPILKLVDIDNLDVFLVDRDLGFKRLAKLVELRKVVP